MQSGKFIVSTLFYYWLASLCPVEVNLWGFFGAISSAIIETEILMAQKQQHLECLFNSRIFKNHPYGMVKLASSFLANTTTSPTSPPTPGQPTRSASRLI